MYSVIVPFILCFFNDVIFLYIIFMLNMFWYII
jgi:hypothetical protein